MVVLAALFFLLRCLPILQRVGKFALKREQEDVIKTKSTRNLTIKRAVVYSWGVLIRREG